jgi:hypothetical protein
MLGEHGENVDEEEKIVLDPAERREIKYTKEQ